MSNYGRVELCQHGYEEITEMTTFGPRLTMTCKSGCGRTLQLLLDQESYWRAKLEPEIREKIAGEIEARHLKGTPDTWDFECVTGDCTHVEDAAIARGGGE